MLIKQFTRMPKIGAFMLVTFLMTACSNPNQTATNHKAVIDSLNTQLDSLYKQSHYAGFAVSIVSEKGTLYQQCFGYANLPNKQPYSTSTIQNIGSISKTFIGVALMKAQEMGKLQLDDPITKYLPFSVKNPHYPNTPITIRHLATHTSGIADGDAYLQKSYILKPNQNLSNAKLSLDDEQILNPADSSMAMDYFLQQLLTPEGKWYNKESFVQANPGTKYEYSNIGATLAALVLEKATGERFDAFTTRYILQPLAMKASGWKFDAVDFSKYTQLYHTKDTVLPHYYLITYPDGNFITSINDLGSYLCELIKGYKGHGTLLKKESYAELFRPQLTTSHFSKRNENNPYNDSYNTGIFMGFSAKGNIGHTGGDPGVNTALFFNPTTGLGELLIINTNINNQKEANDYFGILDKLTQYGTRLQ